LNPLSFTLSLFHFAELKKFYGLNDAANPMLCGNKISPTAC
jgi:hypothetical protein